MSYRAPIDDMILTMRTAAALDEAIERGLFGELDLDLVRAVLEEAGRFAAEELAPLNRVGDAEGARLVDGKVVQPSAFKDAYERWCEAGWAALPCPEEIGGQGLPATVSVAATEIWNAACPALALCPLLTQGVVDALAAAAPDEIKRRYLPKLVSGEWAGTMNLTEPQAGSDLGALRCRAEPHDDGTYRLRGTKIFISYGEHELTENIIHLVLARLPDAPPGTRGISLFLVPKYLVNEDGSLGPRNDVTCAGLEEKLGLHASPTCVMNYGEKEGAVGYLIGEPHKGLKVMFIMMNAARLAVGLQGVAIGERASQQALAYAHERQQGRTAETPPGARAAIVAHPDVKRMLLTMKAMTAAARAICYATAGASDRARLHNDETVRREAAALVALLTPVAKAFSTDAGIESASLGIQVHGGMGYIEETGAAQHWRDSRVYAIYEGTNGIQAIDLVLRKVPLEEGAVLTRYLAALAGSVEDLRGANQPVFAELAAPLGEALAALEEASKWVLANLAANQDQVLAGATPYLRLFGIAAGGVYLARNALAAAREAGGGNAYTAHLDLARFFAHDQAPLARGLARAVMSGAESVLALDAHTLAVV